MALFPVSIVAKFSKGSHAITNTICLYTLKTKTNHSAVKFVPKDSQMSGV